jgi:hypothetical protein
VGTADVVVLVEAATFVGLAAPIELAVLVCGAVETLDVGIKELVLVSGIRL